MSIEAAVSLTAAWIARSPALLAFGGDSAVELLSAVVVLWEFSAHVENRHAGPRAARVGGALLFALAAYVTVVSVLTLLGHNEPRPTYLGMAILIAAVAIMPWLANEKRETVSSYGQCCAEGGCCSVGLVCLSFPDCSSGTRSDGNLARFLG